MKNKILSATIFTVLSAFGFNAVANTDNVNIELVNVAKSELIDSIKAPELDLTTATRLYAQQTLQNAFEDINKTRLIAMRTGILVSDKGAEKAE